MQCTSHSIAYTMYFKTQPSRKYFFLFSCFFLECYIKEWLVIKFHSSSRIKISKNENHNVLSHSPPTFQFLWIYLKEISQYLRINLIKLQKKKNYKSTFSYCIKVEMKSINFKTDQTVDNQSFFV